MDTRSELIAIMQEMAKRATDDDAMLLSTMMNFATAGQKEYYESAIHERALELERQRPPSPDLPEDDRWTSASLLMWMVLKREPEPGELLARKHIELLFSESARHGMVDDYQAAWSRRFPGVEFPLKVQDGMVFRLKQEGSQTTYWEEERTHPFLRIPARWWNDICSHAHLDPANTAAVVFTEPLNGTHRYRAANEAELEQLRQALEQLQDPAAEKQ